MATKADLIAEAWMKECEILKGALEEIHAHMGACLMQRTACDDQIIMEHIQAAHDLSKAH